MISRNSSAGIRLVSTIIAVSDLQHSTEFYSTVFQWNIFLQENMITIYELPNSTHFMLYKKEAFAVNLRQKPEIVSEGAINGTEFYFHTEDLEAVIKRFEAISARCLTPLSERPWGDEAAYYADPDGNVLAIGRPLKK